MTSSTTCILLVEELNLVKLQKKLWYERCLRKQVYKWKLGVAVAALVFSVVSAWAEINESLLIYYIASIGYIIIMTVFIKLFL